MQPIHAALAAVAILAVAATGLGLLATPTDAGLGRIVFVTDEAAPVTAGPVVVTREGVDVGLPTPDNATGGRLVVRLAWDAAQPVPTTVRVDVRVSLPDGNASDHAVSWAYNPAEGASFEETLDLPAWAQVPQDAAGTRAEAGAFGRAWPDVDVALARTDPPRPGLGDPARLVAEVTLLVDVYRATFESPAQPEGGP